MAMRIHGKVRAIAGEARRSPIEREVVSLAYGQRNFLAGVFAAGIVSAVCFSQAEAASSASCSIGSDILIKIELLQGGIAGQSGERTIIAADGCFTVDRVLNDQVTEHLRSGRLGPDQILGARAAIEGAGIASLPARTGSARPVNSALVSITYEGATKAIAVPAASSLEDVEALGAGPPEAPIAKAARLVVRLLRLTH